jgi:hypothetical protein
VIIWGVRDGYCHWCNDPVDDEPIYQNGADTNGAPIAYACCLQCALDRGVINL